MENQGPPVHIDGDIKDFINKFQNIKNIPDFSVKLQRLQRAKEMFMAGAYTRDEVKLLQSFDKFLAIVTEIFTGWDLSMDAARDIISEARKDLAITNTKLSQYAQRDQDQTRDLARLHSEHATLAAQLTTVREAQDKEAQQKEVWRRRFADQVTETTRVQECLVGSQATISALKEQLERVERDSARREAALREEHREAQNRAMLLQLQQSTLQGIRQPPQQQTAAGGKRKRKKNAHWFKRNRGTGAANKCKTGTGQNAASITIANQYNGPIWDRPPPS